MVKSIIMVKRDCSTCINAGGDFNNEVDDGCYMCCKGLEDNYKSVQEDSIEKATRI